METDWKKAATQERAALYRVCKPLTARLGITLDEFFYQATRVRDHGAGYEDNFRAGRISRTKAAQIYQWLRHHHPTAANEVDQLIATLYNSSTTDALWEQFLSEHGQFRTITISLLHHGYAQQRQTQIVPQRFGQEWINEHIQLDQPFRLNFVSPLAGHGIGLQWLNGRWVTLPLLVDRMIVPIAYGSNTYPPPGTGMTLHDPFLKEPKEAGLHRLVIAMWNSIASLKYPLQLDANAPIAHHVLDRLAAEFTALPKEDWCIFRANVMFLDSANLYGISIHTDKEA